MSDYTPYEDELYISLREPLLEGIQAVLTSDKIAARKAHKINPHLRLKDLNRIQNDDIADFSARRLANIAAGLSIRIRTFSLQLPA